MNYQTEKKIRICSVCRYERFAVINKYWDAVCLCIDFQHPNSVTMVTLDIQ